MSDAIRTALAMPQAERIRRWQAMFDVISQQDVLWWRRRFTDALEQHEPA
jgi:trehalose 6-phosphate synthase